MLLAFLAAASAPQPISVVSMTVVGQPTPIELETWFRPDDYPAAAAKAGKEGTVLFEVSVDAEGKPTACRIAKSSGTASLDDTTCRVVMERAKFKPAIVNGKAVAGTFARPTTWRLGGTGLPANGYVAAIVDYAKDPKHPQCSVVQKGMIGGPSCEQVLSHYGSYGTTQNILKFVTLMSVTMGADEPYRGEADWGRRISFASVDLYQTKDGKRSCVVVASTGEYPDPAPCASFNATAVLSDAELKATAKQHLERSAFAIFRPTAGQSGACKSAGETPGCD